MSTTHIQTALATTRKQSDELQAVHSEALATAEIQSAIIIAKQFQRDEDQALQDLLRSCSRVSFAVSTEYEFPRGKTKVRGPSVHLAREAARCWKNIRYGSVITLDTREKRTVRSFAWDVENNSRVEMDDTFGKLIQRKPKDDNGRVTGPAEWIEADERELRELSNRHAAISVRNCILQLLPRDYIEDAVRKARDTVKKNILETPDEFRKKIIEAFMELNVTVEMLTGFLGHPLAQCSPTELDDLRAIWKSIEEGNSTWFDYVAQTKGAPGQDENLAAKSIARAREAIAAAQQTANPPSPDPSAATESGVDESSPEYRERVRLDAAEAQAKINARGGTTKRGSLEKVADIAPTGEELFPQK